jgi:CRP-like cAMP-binding protein
MLRLRGHTQTGTQKGPVAILKFHKGAIVYAQGDPATTWFEVVSGTVRTCFLYGDGHRQLTGFFYPGDIFGIDIGEYSSSAEAVTAVTLRRCWSATGEGENLTGHLPVHGALQSALTNAQACIFLLGRRTAAERLAKFLLTTSQRFSASKAFALPMSRSDIADHLGLTIHTVSRTLSEFVRRNLISLNGPQTVAIVDRDALIDLADGHEGQDGPHARIPDHANANSTDCSTRMGI